MVAHRKDTVGAMVKSKSVYTMTWDRDRYMRRWQCSCGATGSWKTVRTGALVAFWHQHCREEHPDYYNEMLPPEGLN